MLPGRSITNTYTIFNEECLSVIKQGDGGRGSVRSRASGRGLESGACLRPSGPSPSGEPARNLAIMDIRIGGNKSQGINSLLVHLDLAADRMRIWHGHRKRKKRKKKSCTSFRHTKLCMGEFGRGNKVMCSWWIAHSGAPRLHRKSNKNCFGLPLLHLFPLETEGSSGRAQPKVTAQKKYEPTYL